MTEVPQDEGVRFPKAEVDTTTSFTLQLRVKNLGD